MCCNVGNSAYTCAMPWFGRALNTYNFAQRSRLGFSIQSPTEFAIQYMILTHLGRYVCANRMPTKDEPRRRTSLVGELLPDQVKYPDLVRNLVLQRVQFLQLGVVWPVRVSQMRGFGRRYATHRREERA